MKPTPFQVRVLKTVAALLRDGRAAVGVLDVCRAMPELELPPNRFYRAMTELHEKGMIVRRDTYPRTCTGLTPAGQAVLDAAFAEAGSARP
ncbi:MAG: hypothetical protein HYU66_21275 [Armatimonadetes bacterium]|nr:hypothetical protein [Armatimonadota bacterium]